MKKIFLTLLCLLLSGNVLAANPVVRIETNMGNIELELNKEKAPLSVDNFLRYAKEGFYNDTIFHRVIKSFMIQGGGFTTDYERKATHETIDNEAFNGLKNDRGTIAMARTNQPHSASSQFFINTVNNDFLNFKSKSMRGWGYTVFGKVTKGMAVVDKIDGLETGAGGVFSQDVPVTQVVINKVEIISE
ncbi:MAG: peptidylprolyl isomerase [Gammaproteobacteria bacterium]|nr:peptidylprolyl isomerase [Gammaproteobacteria bacterium]